MLIRGILKSCFWISLHQGTLSILCSRIQGYMLSLTNEVNLCLVLPLCVLYEIQNHIFQQLVSEQSSISCLYNMWLSFRIKEKPFSWCFLFSAIKFLHNCVFKSICYVLFMIYIYRIQFFEVDHGISFSYGADFASFCVSKVHCQCS